MSNSDQRSTLSYASRLEVTVRSSIAGMAARKRSANSHATPSVATMPTRATVAAAPARRRRSERGAVARAGAWAGATGTGAGTAGTCGADAGTGSVGRTGGASGRGSVIATDRASRTATPAERVTGVVSGVT